VIAAYRESQRPRPPEPPRFAPAPGPCRCGGAVSANSYVGEGQCVGCGAWWKFDFAAGAWNLDEPGDANRVRAGPEPPGEGRGGTAAESPRPSVAAHA
jgi:hypothetical protein